MSEEEREEYKSKKRPWYYAYVYIALVIAIIYSLADWAYSNLSKKPKKEKVKGGKGKKSK